MAKLVTKGEEGGVEGFLNRHSPLNIFQDVDFHDKNFTVEQVL